MFRNLISYILRGIGLFLLAWGILNLIGESRYSFLTNVGMIAAAVIVFILSYKVLPRIEVDENGNAKPKRM
jgi:hypothetical protein